MHIQLWSPVQGQEVLSCLFHCSRYYLAYILRIIISLGNTAEASDLYFFLLLGNGGSRLSFVSGLMSPVSRTSPFSSLLSPTSHLMSHVSCLTFPVSRLLSHMSNFAKLFQTKPKYSTVHCTVYNVHLLEVLTISLSVSFSLLK